MLRRVESYRPMKHGDTHVNEWVPYNYLDAKYDLFPPPKKDAVVSQMPLPSKHKLEDLGSLKTRLLNTIEGKPHRVSLAKCTELFEQHCDQKRPVCSRQTDAEKKLMKTVAHSMLQNFRRVQKTRETHSKPMLCDDNITYEILFARDSALD